MKKIVVIGTSAGGMEALQTICAGLPADFPGAVLIVMHIGAFESHLPAILSKFCHMPVSHARDGQVLAGAEIVIAPSDRHMLLLPGATGPRIRLSNGARENFTRPAIDPLFRSAAASYGAKVIGVVLSGYLDDGTVGLQAIKECGGMAIVQEPLDSPVPDMPSSAIDHVDVDLIAAPEAIATALVLLASGASDDAPAPLVVPEWIEIENRFAANRGDVGDLRRIGRVSPYSCPECSGNLWQMQGGIQRFRCHTGHSFTAEALAKLQERDVEDALWTALRALHEQEMLATQRACDVSPDEAQRHRLAAARSANAALIVRQLLEC